jgi:hypothetical protein
MKKADKPVTRQRVMKNWLAGAIAGLAVASACDDSASGTRLGRSDVTDGDASSRSEPPDADSAVPADSGPAPHQSDGEVKVPGGKPTVSTVIASVGFTQYNDDPYPVLLFQGGYASYDLDQIVKPIDIADDIVDNPEEWPEWRRGSGGVELKGEDGWETLLYTYECSALPKGTTLSGLFEWSFVSNIGGGGGASRGRYRFAEDGTFASCEAVKIVTLSGSDTTREEHKGRYEIDGYKIKFSYDNAASETLPFFYDPTKPKRVWVGKHYYPTPSGSDTALCVEPH